MNRAIPTVAVAATMLLLVCLGCIRVPRVPDDAVGSIAVLGDTQMMTEPAPLSLAGKFEGATGWLQSYAEALHLGFTIQVGDLTNGTYKSGGFTEPATNPLGLTEMAYAKRAMDKLWRPASGPAVPWTVSLGNHDIDQWCWGAAHSPKVVSPDPRCTAGGMIIGGGAIRSTANFNETFPPSYFMAMPTWGGQQTAANVDDNFNNFNRLRIGRQQWLVVSLMWSPQPADFDWANRVIDQEVAADPDVRVIVVTHAFMHPTWHGDPATLNAGPGFGSARELYDNVLNRHPQIRLVLSGHYPEPEPIEPTKQCVNQADPATFGPCQWIRNASVEVPATEGRPAYTFHAVLTDYSYNGDLRTKQFFVQSDQAAPEGPVQVERLADDNAYFRLLTFDTVHNTIRVRTITDPANVAPASPPPPGCAPTSLADLGIETPVCGKTDGAYGTSADDYTLEYS